MKQHYGKPTVAKDNIQYKSIYEANFVNKMLYGKNLPYEYDKKYPNSNLRYDFFIEPINLYIECVYHTTITNKKYYYQTTVNKEIILNTPYEKRHIAKRNGAWWNPHARYWSWTSTGHANPALHQFMEESQLKMVTERVSTLENSTFISDNYVDKISEKIANWNPLITEPSDLDFNNLSAIILDKADYIIINQIISEYRRLFPNANDLIEKNKNSSKSYWNMKLVSDYFKFVYTNDPYEVGEKHIIEEKPKIIPPEREQTKKTNTINNKPKRKKKKKKKKKRNTNKKIATGFDKVSQEINKLKRVKKQKPVTNPIQNCIPKIKKISEPLKKFIKNKSENK